jgi:hypothetical protein
MTYTPEHLDRWTSKDPAFGSTNNYGGDDFSDFYIAPVGYNRDNEDTPYIKCNWEVVTEAIQKVSTHDETDSYSFGHWACGWYELFLIHKDDAGALECADKWAASLADYPIADEDRLSELELEDQVETYENCLKTEWHSKVQDAIYDVMITCAHDDEADELAEALCEVNESMIDEAFWEASQYAWYDSGEGQWCRVDDVPVPPSLISAMLYPVDEDQLVLPVT